MSKVKEKVDKASQIPPPFIFRRLHSLMGLWLVIYLVEHLFVNSQIGLYFLDEGRSFIHLVNRIYDLPFLPVVEILFLGFPFFIHMVWGVMYLRTAKVNSFPGDGSKPSLPHYKRNRGYTWQRVTSWILLIAILLHVIQMRFVERPRHFESKGQSLFTIRLKEDKSLLSVATKIHATLYDESALLAKQKLENEEWIEKVLKKPLKKDEVVAVMNRGGEAIFLMLRETFKSPLMVILYTLFVLAACYHAFNGLWTLCITWGLTITQKAQNTMRLFTNFLMTLTALMGLIAIWGTYWALQFQG